MFLSLMELSQKCIFNMRLTEDEVGTLWMSTCLSVIVWPTEAAASPTRHSNHAANPKFEMKLSCMSSYVNRYFPFS